MPVRGADQVRKNMKAVFDRLQGPMTEKTVTEIMILGGTYADAGTPVDVGTLINSRFRVVEQTPSGWRGKYGYTAAYAAAVHSYTGKLRGQPRAHFGKTSEGREFGGGTLKGNYWDGALGSGKANTQWLTKGFEEAMPDIKELIKGYMKI